MPEIVLLALVALFVGLRLYSVLGRRTGHEQQPILKPAEPAPAAEAPRQAPGAPVERPEPSGFVYEEPAAPGIRAIVGADPATTIIDWSGVTPATRTPCDSDPNNHCVNERGRDMIHFDSVHSGRLARLTLDGKHVARAAVRVNQTDQALTATYFNHFNDLVIQNASYGVFINDGTFYYGRWENDLAFPYHYFGVVLDNRLAA